MSEEKFCVSWRDLSGRFLVNLFCIFLTTFLEKFVSFAMFTSNFLEYNCEYYEYESQKRYFPYTNQKEAC